MGTEPMFPIDDMDLNAAPLADRAMIADSIPHRGDMLMLDEILWYDERFENGIARRRVGADEFWCSGHVPSRPIMPGVLLVEAGAQLAAWLYYQFYDHRWFAGFTRIEETSFHVQVVPGDELLLLCGCRKRSERRFICDIQGIVDGKIAFKSLITGMAFPKVGEVPRVPLDSVPTTGQSLQQN